MITTTDKDIFEKFGIVSYERDVLREQINIIKSQYETLNKRYNDAIERLKEKDGAPGLDT